MVSIGEVIEMTPRYQESIFHYYLILIQYNAVLHTLQTVAITVKELSRDTPYNS